MTSDARPGKVAHPTLEARRRLGDELRQVRLAVRASTRQVPGWTTGHISSVETGRTQPSLDLIKTYVRAFGGDEVTLHALFDAAVAETAENNRFRNAQRPGHYPTSEPDEASGLPSPSTIRRSCVVETDDTTYSFNSKGIVEEVRVAHTIRARPPQVRFFYASHDYMADPRRGVLAVEAGSGCQLEKVEESGNGSIRIYLSLSKVVDPEDREPHAFSYRVLVSSSVRTLPMLCRQPGSATVVHYTVRAQFRPPALPTEIWWFASETYAEAGSSQSDEHVFERDTTGYYFKDFYKLVNGWNYGLCWQWPEE